MICPGCTTTAARDVRDYAKKTGFGRELYAVLDIETAAEPTAPHPKEIDGAEMATRLLDELVETPDGTSPFPTKP